MKDELRITKKKVVAVNLGRLCKRLIGRNGEKHKELHSGKPNSRLRRLIKSRKSQTQA
jgi:hypothetical protein